MAGVYVATHTISVTQESFDRIQRALSEQGAHQRNLAAQTSHEGMRKGYENESKAFYELAKNLRLKIEPV